MVGGQPPEQAQAQGRNKRRMPLPRETRCAVGSLSTGGESGRHTHIYKGVWVRASKIQQTERETETEKDREIERDGTKYRLDRKGGGRGQKKKNTVSL